MMSADEILAVETALRTIEGAVTALEWGSGGSTLRFSGLMPAGSTWLAVEHQGGWYKRVRRALSQRGLQGVEVHLVKPDKPYTEGTVDGDAQTFESYIRLPSTRNLSFNFVLLDGRSRIACARSAWSMLRADGIMVLHDAQREQYEPARPRDAWRVLVRDPSRMEAGDIAEVHFFVRTNAQALAGEIKQQVDPAVQVELDPPLASGTCAPN